MMSQEMHDTIDHAKLYTTDPVTGEQIPFHEKSLDFGEMMQRDLDNEPMRDIPFMVKASATVEIPQETAKSGDKILREYFMECAMRKLVRIYRKELKKRRPIRDKRRRK